MANPPKHVQDRIDMAISKIRFESATITFTPAQLEAMVEASKVNGGMFADHTKETREATRLYVESWIVPLLESIRDGERNRWMDRKS